MLRKIKELLFINRSIKQIIIKNTIWLTASTIAGRVIRGIVIIYAARILGTEGYGVFSYAMSLAAFFSLFSDMGLTGLLTREVTKNLEEKASFIKTVFIIKIIILVFGLFLTIILSPFFVKISAAQPIIPLAALLVLFDGLRTFGFGFARAKNKMEIEGILSFLTDVFITIFSIWFLTLSPSPYVLSIAYLIGSFWGSFFVFLVLKKEIKELSGKIDKKFIKPIFSVSIPFAIMGIFGSLMINIDTVILGFFRNANELGLYAAAQRPVQLLYMIPTLIASSIFPIISRFAHEKQKEKARFLVEYSLLAVLLIAIPITIGGIILAKPIIQLLFGNSYISAFLAFQILISTILFVFPGTIIGNTIFSFNLQKKLVMTTGIGALANTLFDFLLIPFYGINGSAVATIISQILTNVLNWHILKKHINFSITGKLKNILIASLGMAVATFVFFVLSINVIFIIIISAIIYGGILLLCKEKMIIEFLNLILKLKK